MAKRMADNYAQRAFVEVTQASANTIAFQQVRFAVGVFQGIGLLLHKVEWFPATAMLTELEADADQFDCALTLRDDLANLNPTNQSVITRQVWNCETHGTAANTLINELPSVAEYTALPGGGLLLPANPIFISLDSNGLASAGTMRAVVYFTFKELSDQESIELLQTIIPGNV